MQVNENEEDQAVILAKEDEHVLSLFHTIYTKRNKGQENTNLLTVIITFKT